MIDSPGHRVSSGMLSRSLRLPCGTLLTLSAPGLPLDNRACFTKPERMIRAASMNGGNDEVPLHAPKIAAYLNATPGRVPFSDWYETLTARKLGFQARSVLGGLFLPMLLS